MLFQYAEASFSHFFVLMHFYGLFIDFVSFSTGAVESITKERKRNCCLMEGELGVQ